MRNESVGESISPSTFPQFTKLISNTTLGQKGSEGGESLVESICSICSAMTKEDALDLQNELYELQQIAQLATTPEDQTKWEHFWERLEPIGFRYMPPRNVYPGFWFTTLTLVLPGGRYCPFCVQDYLYHVTIEQAGDPRIEKIMCFECDGSWAVEEEPDVSTITAVERNSSKKITKLRRIETDSNRVLIDNLSWL